MTDILWSSDEAALATGGTNTCDWSASGVSIDTRTLNRGDIFVAITDKRDGHDFVAEAFAKGASAAIVSSIPDNVCHEKPFLIVNDVRPALTALALFGRQRCKAKVIAITGSVGKTSSKDMLGTVLLNFGKVNKAEKSFNNHLGVSLTLARTLPDSDFLVVEIGMSNKKEIAPLSALVRPHVALITDVSEAHLASFENIDEIAREKSDICFGVCEGGFCIVSRDSQRYFNLFKYIERFNVSILSFGKKKAADYKIMKTVVSKNKVCANAMLQNGVEIFFKINSPGVHHARNALGIIAVLEVLGLDVTQGILGLSKWLPAAGRGTITNIKCNSRSAVTTFTIIDETYNANPTSLAASVKMLADLSRVNLDFVRDAQLRRIAILGDMLELGANENQKHADLALELDLENIDVIHCIGTCMKFFYKNVPDSKKGKWVKTVKEFSEIIKELIKDQDVIMLKASNGIGLDLLVTELNRMGNPN